MVLVDLASPLRPFTPLLWTWESLTVAEAPSRRIPFALFPEIVEFSPMATWEFAVALIPFWPLSLIWLPRTSRLEPSSKIPSAALFATVLLLSVALESSLSLIPFAWLARICESFTEATALPRARPSMAFSETTELLARSTWEELVA